jgi:hypothetical protein
MRGNTVQLQYVDTSTEQQIDVSTVGIHRSLQNEQTLVPHQGFPYLSERHDMSTCQPLDIGAASICGQVDMIRDTLMPR